MKRSRYTEEQIAFALKQAESYGEHQGALCCTDRLNLPLPFKVAEGGVASAHNTADIADMLERLDELFSKAITLT